MTCVWYHIKPYEILFPKIHEPPKVKCLTLQPLCGGWSYIPSRKSFKNTACSTYLIYSQLRSKLAKTAFYCCAHLHEIFEASFIVISFHFHTHQCQYIQFANIQACDFSGFFRISGYFTNLPLPQNGLERREVASKERKK